MTSADLAGVVFAAGVGSRLRPLTAVRPKALCPVANVPLLDSAVARIEPFVGAGAVAVNVHAHAEQVRAHVGSRLHLSFESQPLGTAGALGRLRAWIDGRPVLATNADAWHDFALDALVDGWDGERVRVVVVHDDARPDFGGAWRYAGSCLLPGSVVEALDDRVTSLYDRVWRPAEERGELERVAVDGAFVDCGTPADYLLANLLASGGRSVIGEGAEVRGTLERSVVWPGAVVDAGERLVECVRATRSCTVAAPLGDARLGLLASVRGTPTD